MVSSNTLTITKEMADLFSSNLLGIDVDVSLPLVSDLLVLNSCHNYQDNYRIVYFGDLDGTKNRLKAHLDLSVINFLNDEFLRIHFAHTLNCCTCGGDLTVEYERDLEEWSEELIAGDPETEDDPSWQTPIGQLILNWELTRRLRNESRAA